MQLVGFDYDQERFYLKENQKDWFFIFLIEWVISNREEKEFVVFEYYNYSMVMELQQINQVVYIEDQKIEHNVDR